VSAADARCLVRRRGTAFTDPDQVVLVLVATIVPRSTEPNGAIERSSPTPEALS
jgi:hypothetical protein